MQGKESLELYNKAIEIITNIAKEIESSSNKDIQIDPKAEQKIANSPQTLKQELSNSFCAVAELWMTDLCDESEAEHECDSNINKAIEADDSNPEAWQTKARFHLIKSEFEVNIDILFFQPKTIFSVLITMINIVHVMTLGCEI